MNRWMSLSAACALSIALLAIRPGFSDDAKEKAKPAKAASKASSNALADKSAKPKKPSNRLPNYYGKIGISDEQREKIYAIQDDYMPQIAELKKQMAELVKKRNQEIQAVLTESQRRDLIQAREEAKKRALERVKKKAAARQSTAKVKPATKDEK